MVRIGSPDRRTSRASSAYLSPGAVAGPGRIPGEGLSGSETGRFFPGSNFSRIRPPLRPATAAPMMAARMDGAVRELDRVRSVLVRDRKTGIARGETAYHPGRGFSDCTESP